MATTRKPRSEAEPHRHQPRDHRADPFGSAPQAVRMQHRSLRAWTGARRQLLRRDENLAPLSIDGQHLQAARRSGGPSPGGPRDHDDHRRQDRAVHRPRRLGRHQPRDLSVRDPRRPLELEPQGRGVVRRQLRHAVHPGRDGAAARAAASLNHQALSKGFGYLISSELVNGRRGNGVLQGETLMMIKEYIIERYGVPKFFIGSGGSGGAIQQLVITQMYPGLLDGLMPSLTFPDSSLHTIDSILLTNLWPKLDKNVWTQEKITAVEGFTPGTARAWNTAYGRLGVPTNAAGCALADKTLIFDPVDQPEGRALHDAGHSRQHLRARSEDRLGAASDRQHRPAIRPRRAQQRRHHHRRIPRRQREGRRHRHRRQGRRRADRRRSDRAEEHRTRAASRRPTTRRSATCRS